MVGPASTCSLHAHQDAGHRRRGSDHHEPEPDVTRLGIVSGMSYRWGSLLLWLCLRGALGRDDRRSCYDREARLPIQRGGYSAKAPAACRPFVLSAPPALSVASKSWLLFAPSWRTLEGCSSSRARQGSGKAASCVKRLPTPQPMAMTSSMDPASMATKPSPMHPSLT